MDLKEYIKSKSPIIPVVKDFVELKKRGGYYTGKCCFHDDSSPSLSVDPNTNRWKCFGCNAKGDSIAFVMEITGCTFMQALAYLIERFNIPQPEALRRKYIRAQIREEESKGNLEAAKAFARELD